MTFQIEEKIRSDMGRIFLEHIGGSRLFTCASCDTVLTNKSVEINLLIIESSVNFYQGMNWSAPDSLEPQGEPSSSTRWSTYTWVRWWTGSCWLADTWSGTSTVRTATPSWAGCTSSPPRIIRDTRRAELYWSGLWSRSVMGLTSIQSVTKLESLGPLYLKSRKYIIMFFCDKFFYVFLFLSCLSKNKIYIQNLMFSLAHTLIEF